MTTSAANSSSYTGNGATQDFSTGFYFLAETEVVVVMTNAVTGAATQTLGVHYTLTMPASVGAYGTVHMVTAPTSNDVLAITRVVPFTQEIDLRTSGVFDPDTHEQALDRMAFQAQQLDRRLTVVEAQGTAGSVVAGTGLSFSGTTLNVGAGTGLSVDATNVSIAYNDAVGLAAIAPGTASSSGVNAAPSRVDHTHGVSTDTALEITDAATDEGVALSLSRSDHLHSHGARGGGTLHAAATTVTAGFMSSADKTSLDALVTAGVPSTTSITTTTNTVETSIYAAPADGTTTFAQIDIVAGVVGSESSLAGSWRIIHHFVVTGGGTMAHVVADVTEFVNTGGFTAPTATVSGSGGGSGVVSITGTLATTIKWHLRISFWTMAH